jgi:hypothetical protein
MIPVSWRYEGQFNYIAIENGLLVYDDWSFAPRKYRASIGMHDEDIPVTVRPCSPLRSASRYPYRRTSRWPSAIYDLKNCVSNRSVQFQNSPPHRSSRNTWTYWHAARPKTVCNRSFWHPPDAPACLQAHFKTAPFDLSGTDPGGAASQPEAPLLHRRHARSRDGCATAS